jgi:hypothetical protein
MRLAKDTRQTLDLVIEALIEFLDAIGPDPEAKPSLSTTSAVDQEFAWDLHAGFVDECEDKHDGREPSEDELHFYDEANRASIHDAHEQARTALRALLKRASDQALP